MHFLFLSAGIWYLCWDSGNTGEMASVMTSQGLILCWTSNQLHCTHDRAQLSPSVKMVASVGKHLRKGKNAHRWKRMEQKEWETAGGTPRSEEEEEKRLFHGGTDIHFIAHGGPHARTPINYWRAAADSCGELTLEHRKSETAELKCCVLSTAPHFPLPVGHFI